MKQKGEWGKWGVWLYPPKIPYLDLWTRDDDVIEEAVGSRNQVEQQLCGIMAS